MSTTGAIVPSRGLRIWGWVRAKTQSLSDVRDLVLLAAGACYGVGYLVWSIHAWHRNLGLLPALRFQYLIAGAIPILFVLALYGLLWGLFRLRHRIAAWAEAPAGFKRLVSRGPLLLATGSAVVLNAISSLVFYDQINVWGEELNMVWLVRVRTGSLFALYVFGFLMPPPAKRAVSRNTSWWSKAVIKTVAYNGIRWIMVGYTVVFVVIGAWWGVRWFTLEAYPRIPQELGGVRPRRAVVYLSTESRLAPEILATLRGAEGDQPDGGGPPLHEVEEAATGSDKTEEEAPAPREGGARGQPPTEESGKAQTVMIVEVDVHFADGNMLLVKPVGEDRPWRRPTYEIRRQSLAAISWQ